jgi:hypothetical protein
MLISYKSIGDAQQHECIAFCYVSCQGPLLKLSKAPHLASIHRRPAIGLYLRLIGIRTADRLGASDALVRGAWNADLVVLLGSGKKARQASTTGRRCPIMNTVYVKHICLERLPG